MNIKVLKKSDNLYLIYFNIKPTFEHEKFIMSMCISEKQNQMLIAKDEIENYFSKDIIFNDSKITLYNELHYDQIIGSMKIYTLDKRTFDFPKYITDDVYKAIEEKISNAERAFNLVKIHNREYEKCRLNYVTDFCEITYDLIIESSGVVVNKIENLVYSTIEEDDIDINELLNKKIGDKIIIDEEDGYIKYIQIKDALNYIVSPSNISFIDVDWFGDIDTYKELYTKYVTICELASFALSKIDVSSIPEDLKEFYKQTNSQIDEKNDEEFLLSYVYSYIKIIDENIKSIKMSGLLNKDYYFNYDEFEDEFLLFCEIQRFPLYSLRRKKMLIDYLMCNDFLQNSK